MEYGFKDYTREGNVITASGLTPAEKLVNAPRRSPVDFADGNHGVLVHAQNVYDYFEAHGRAQGWDDLRTFVCVTPPFPHMVVSYLAQAWEGRKRVDDIHVDVEIKQVHPNYIATLLGHIEEFNKEMYDQAKEYFEAMLPGTLLAFRVAYEGIRFNSLMLVFIDETGKIKNHKDKFFLAVKAKSEAEDDLVPLIMNRETVVALGTLNFMNCKNVEVLDNPPTRQQRRNAERRNEPPPPTYKTLTILPFKRKIRHTRIPGTPSTVPPPLHIVRGHFKDYRNSGLGRGHAKGVWWWHPHVRGDESSGRVEKDYEVKS